MHEGCAAAVVAASIAIACSCSIVCLSSGQRQCLAMAMTIAPTSVSVLHRQIQQTNTATDDEEFTALFKVRALFVDRTSWLLTEFLFY